MSYPLVTKYGEDSRWINWKLEKVKNNKGELKETKVPYYSKFNRASSTDPSTWATYQEASIRLDNGTNGFSGIGIILNDHKIVCIDVDHVVKEGKIVSDHAEEILKLLKVSDSFTEISQSGTGIHIFLECSTPFKPLANKKAPYEVYADVRFIATTGDSYHKIPKDIRTVNEDELVAILNTIGYPWGRDEQAQSPQDVTVSIQELTDDEVIVKMFNSKNGADIKKLYDGDTSKYEDDESRADAGLLSTLAFWTGKNSIQMERLWKASPLGQRKKTQTRSDYRMSVIKFAIDNCKNVYSPRTKTVENQEFLTVFSKQNGLVVIPCKENVLIAMRITEGVRGKFRYNAWIERRETLLESNDWRPVRDNDYNLVQSILSNTYEDYALRTASMTFVTSAVMQYCEENTVDPMKDYMSSLVWDGTNRLDSWISTVCHTDGYEKEYATFGTQWMKALVKRIMVPGCKFDNVLVLEGDQGIRKSTAFNILGGEHHVEVTTNPGDKDFFLLMSGKMIVEFSEGESQERGSMKLLKSIITTQVDVYRAPYAREIESHPRRCVFAMTTNDSRYLKDDTGNRRWLPVKCIGNLDTDWLQENREQLFAEAYHKAITLNENIYDGLNSDTIRDMQNERRVERFEEEDILVWYNGLKLKDKENGVTAKEVFFGCLAKDEFSQMTQLQQIVIPSILRNVLHLKDSRRRDGRISKRVYVPTDKTWAIVDKEPDDF